MTEFTLKSESSPEVPITNRRRRRVTNYQNQNMIYGQRHINIMMDIKLQETLGIMLLIIGIGVWLQQKMDKVRLW